MAALAWLLFISGTLVAALFGAKVPPDWPVFSVGVVVAVIGAVLLRRQIAAQAGAGSSEGGGIADLAGLKQALEGTVSAAASLDDLTDPDALKEGVESVLMEGLMPVVAARLMLVSAHGIEDYARVFTPIASAERCLNRAWSALVDGYPDEARPQVVEARRHMGEALNSWPQ